MAVKPRLETSPGIFTACGDTKQRILDQIEDPSVKKLIVMRWRERGEISDSETERLIRDNGLASA